MKVVRRCKAIGLCSHCRQTVDAVFNACFENPRSGDRSYFGIPNGVAGFVASFTGALLIPVNVLGC